MSEWKYASELVVGYLIKGIGPDFHRIARIALPTPRTLAILPECLGYAIDSQGWGITLIDPFMRLEVG